MKIAVCPQCRGKFNPAEKEDGLNRTVCTLPYKIRDSIPVMLIRQAISPDSDSQSHSGRFSRTRFMKDTTRMQSLRIIEIH